MANERSKACIFVLGDLIILRAGKITLSMRPKTARGMAANLIEAAETLEGDIVRQLRIADQAGDIDPGHN